MPESTLCTTCLSNLEEGAKLTETLSNFLCDVLQFKAELLQRSQKIICRKCYKTVIELKCFYTQLRDVEVYFESKSDSISNSRDDPRGIADEADSSFELPYLEAMECNVSIAEENKLDPILIDEDEDCCVVENDVPAKKMKTNTNSTRFVCLTCSKLFGSVDDLQRHENSKHFRQQTLQKTTTVFVPASPQATKKQQLSCQECGKEFNNKLSLDTHTKTHQKTKSNNFLCSVCKQLFSSKELLHDHQNQHGCNSCPNKYCSLAALQTHEKHAHNKNLNGTQT